MPISRLGHLLKKKSYKVFVYEGADGIALFAVANSDGGDFTGSVGAQFNFVGASSTSLEVSDESGNITLSSASLKRLSLTQQKTFFGNWVGANDTLGGAFNLNNVGDQWVAEVLPNDFDGLTKFEVMDGGGGVTSVIISEDPTGVGQIQNITSNDPQELISYVGDVPTLLGGPNGMAIANTILDQDMVFTYDLAQPIGTTNDVIDYITVSAKATKQVALSLQVVDNEGITFTYSFITIDPTSDYQFVDFIVPLSIRNSNNVDVTNAMIAGKISRIVLKIAKPHSAVL